MLIFEQLLAIFKACCSIEKHFLHSYSLWDSISRLLAWPTNIRIGQKRLVSFKLTSLSHKSVNYMPSYSSLFCYVFYLVSIARFEPAIVWLWVKCPTIMLPGHNQSTRSSLISMIIFEGIPTSNVGFLISPQILDKGGNVSQCRTL